MVIEIALAFKASQLHQFTQGTHANQVSRLGLPPTTDAHETQVSEVPLELHGRIVAFHVQRTTTREVISVVTKEYIGTEMVVHLVYTPTIRINGMRMS